MAQEHSEMQIAREGRVHSLKKEAMDFKGIHAYQNGAHLHQLPGTWASCCLA
jgi:hypothetical protein